MEATPTPEAEAPETFVVSPAGLADLTTRFARLARRAERLGVPAPSFTVVETFDIPEMVPALSYEIDGAMEPSGRLLTRHALTVQGDAPKYDGWSMLAVIDRDLDKPNTPNVVHLVGDTQLLPAWREVGDVCDHCNPPTIARGRKLLVVVEHDNGERKVVVTTCLHDFLGGTSPAAIAAWIATLSTLRDLFLGADDDDERDEYRGGRIEERFDPEMFLAHVARSIDDHGWTSRGAANEYHIATVDRVLNEITDRKVRPAQPSDANVQLALDALAWAQEVDPGTNDYLLNMSAVAAKQGWRGRDLGLGGSIISAYQRELGYRAERAAQVAEQTAPCPNGKVTITGTVVKFSEVEGFRGGTVTKMTVLADEGYKVWGTVPRSLDPVWGDTGDGYGEITPGVEIGDKITFTANVTAKDDTFGWFKNPSKASIVQTAAVA